MTWKAPDNMNPIYIDTETDYEEALKYVHDHFIIVNYEDLTSQAIWYNMVLAVEEYEECHYQ
jgi:hypothetical protein